MITPVMDYPKTLNTVEYKSVDIITGGEEMNDRKFRDGQIVRHRLSGEKLLIIQKSIFPTEKITYMARMLGYTVKEFDEVELEEEMPSALSRTAICTG